MPNNKKKKNDLFIEIFNSCSINNVIQIYKCIFIKKIFIMLY